MSPRGHAACVSFITFRPKNNFPEMWPRLGNPHLSVSTDPPGPFVTDSLGPALGKVPLDHVPYQVAGGLFLVFVLL